MYQVNYQDPNVKAAREAGATHQHSTDPYQFYRYDWVHNETFIARFKDGEQTRLYDTQRTPKWEWDRYGKPPEWAVIL